MRIFGVDKWQKIADYFYAHAEERLGKLKELRENMLHSLGEEECGSLQEFQEQIAHLEAQLEGWEQEYYRRNKNRVKLQKNYSAEELAEQEKWKALLG
jgi:hypothetical protein